MYPISLSRFLAESSILLCMENARKDAVPVRRRPTPWLLLLLLPYAGLIFPQLYARSTPALFGFPFFYWYQFGWVLLASVIMAFVYVKTRD